MNNKALYTTFSAICGCAVSVAGFNSMQINFLCPFYFNGCHGAETSSFKKISNYTFKKCTYMLGNSTQHAAKMGGINLSSARQGRFMIGGGEKREKCKKRIL